MSIVNLNLLKAVACTILCLAAMSLCEAQYVRGGFTINRDLYTLRWEVFGPFVTFRAIARGTGYVGFGLSPKGTMEGADLFVSGMYENGTVYAVDAHGAGEKDDMSNYMLLFLRQTDMYTEVHFRRALFTRDCKDDIRIVNEPQYVIWSIGPAGDALVHHGNGKENRGSVLVNLLNPPMFHAYYSTAENKGMDDMAGCINSGGSTGGAAAAAPPPAEDAPAEKQEAEPDATLLSNPMSQLQSDCGETSKIEVDGGKAM